MVAPNTNMKSSAHNTNKLPRQEEFNFADQILTEEDHDSASRAETSGAKVLNQGPVSA